MDEATVGAELFIATVMADVPLRGDKLLQVQEIIRRTYRIAYVTGMKSALEKVDELIEESKDGG